MFKGIHKKTSPRLTSVIQKTLQGESLRIAVIGGSNSAGGGIENKDDIFYRMFVSWWNHVIKPKTGSLMQLSVLALGGTGSDFFSLCLQNYIHRGAIAFPDIIIVKLSVNDYGTRYGAAAKPLEQLTRILLNLPSKPAVFYVNLVDNIEEEVETNRIFNPLCRNVEDLGQSAIAKHYGITSFSWRDVVCPKTKNGEHVIQIKPGMLNKDGAHIGKKSHVQLAYIMIHFFQTSVKETLQSDCSLGKSNSNSKDEGNTPTPIFLKSSELLHNVGCFTLISPQCKKRIISQTMKIKVTQNQGFQLFAPDQKLSYKYVHAKSDRTDSFGGWIAETTGSFLKVNVLVSCDGYSNNFTAHTMNALNTSHHDVQQEEKQFFTTFHKSPYPNPSSPQEVGGHHVTHQCQGHDKHSSTQSQAFSVYRSLGVVIRSSNIGAVGKIVFDDNPESAVAIYTKNKGEHLIQTRLYWILKRVAPGNHTSQFMH